MQVKFLHLISIFWLFGIIDVPSANRYAGNEEMKKKKLRNKDSVLFQQIYLCAKFQPHLLSV